MRDMQPEEIGTRSGKEKPKHHQSPLIKIETILPHNNADSLEIIPIEGYQAVVKKGSFKIGDWGVYLYPDSLAPIRKEFDFLFVNAYENGILRDGMRTVPAKYRRIRAKKLRGEWSEGLLLPAREFPEFQFDGTGIPCYDGKVAPNDVSEILAVEHYQPPDPEDLGGQNERGPKSPYPRSLKGWLYWVWYRIKGLFGFYDPTRGSNERGPKREPSFYDIENFKNHVGAFEEGEEVWISEKIHGCQGRFIYQDGHMYAGSRRLWKHPKSKCVWRKVLADHPWIEEWCKNHENYTLYGEVFPVQGPDFMYGVKQGNLQFAVFDILKPDHTWLDYEDLWFSGAIIVPTITSGSLLSQLFDSNKVKELAQGKSAIDGKTIREGIVIKPKNERHVRGLGRLVLKVINPEYLLKS